MKPINFNKSEIQPTKLMTTSEFISVDQYKRQMHFSTREGQEATPGKQNLLESKN